MFPTRYRMTIGSEQQEVIIDNIAVNQTIPDERFNLPADIQALVARTKR